jgi:transcriptional regulator GlxA family with amidase domain
MQRRAVFVYFSQCEVLDFAGPLQALHEANAFIPAPYEIVHCAGGKSATTAQGLQLGGLDPLPQPRSSDLVFIPGYPVREVSVPRELDPWLRRCRDAGAEIFATCTGAFVLARAGLLNGRACTTHWKYTEELQRRYPRARVLGGQLYVRDGSLNTSAGITAGIDMTLDFIERTNGAVIAAKVAREMVVYIRREGAHKQESIYLAYRSHIDPGVHAVQDYLIAHPDEQCSLAGLAKTAHMSIRTLTRAFARATGTSIASYRTRLRLERAKVLLADPAMTIDAIASRCGFSDARQLRRLWRAQYGSSPRYPRRRTISS